MMGFGLLGLVATVAAGAVSSMLSLGTYGTLRDRGWGPWGAGAATGAVGGIIGGLGLLLFGGKIQEAMATQQMSGVFAERVSGLSTPMVITGLTMSRLSGMPIKVNGMGASLEDLQLGGYGVDLRTMQVMQ